MYGGHFPPQGHEEMLRSPPFCFVDGESREVDVRVCGRGPVDAEFEALVGMYLDFDPSFRTLGIPPVDEPKVREWLETILEGYSTVAWHGDRAVGHAVLVAEPDDGHELAIFLHQEYHGAGIGTQLLEALLTHGREHGVDHVWLLVEGDNRPAVNLYNDVGFVVTDSFQGDVEMELAM
jgi:ribosomal protein S18 acetylase RimI-like enzyme